MRLQADINSVQQKLKTQFKPQSSKFEVNVNTSGAVIKDHNALNNRDMDNQHPMNAITGLNTVVSDVDKLKQTQPNSNEEIENILKNFN